jgi:acyl carrier protein
MDQAGDRQLIAYVVPVPNTKVLPLELCRFAAEKLPSYMHPQGCVVLDTIPLTPNGKVDHAKLPPPQENRTLEGEAKPPVTAEQTHISSIWRDILRVNEVGVDDNFFDLGGHSLLAMQVISRWRDAYAVNISLLSFFESPTVAGLADLVATAKLKSREPARAGNEQAAVPARDKGDI